LLLLPCQNDVCELKTKSVHSFTVIFPNDIYRSFDTVKEKKIIDIYLSKSTHVTLSVSPVRCKHWHINLYSKVNLNFRPYIVRCTHTHVCVCVCFFVLVWFTILIYLPSKPDKKVGGHVRKRKVTQQLKKHYVGILKRRIKFSYNRRSAQ